MTLAEALLGKGQLMGVTLPGVCRRRGEVCGPFTKHRIRRSKLNPSTRLPEGMCRAFSEGHWVQHCPTGEGLLSVHPG